MPKKFIIKFRHFLKPDEMYCLAREIKEDLEKDGFYLMNDIADIYVIDDEDLIQIVENRKEE